MTVFFTLSGFVMWLNYAESISKGEDGAVRRFAVARIARLWPMYLLTFAIAVMISDPIELQAAFSRSAYLPDRRSVMGSGLRRKAARHFGLSCRTSLVGQY